jgi:hypothetical protein
VLQEGGRLALPDLHALPVDDVLQRVDVGGAEAAEEVAGGGGVGDAWGAEGVEVSLVGAQPFEVLQARAAGQDVFSPLRAAAAARMPSLLTAGLPRQGAGSGKK